MSSVNRIDNLSLVYWGTLITSIGSLAFPGATIGVLTQAGYTLFEIGMVVAIMRFGALSGGLVFGDIAERFNAKVVILVAEVLAFLLTVGLIFVWQLGGEFFYLFCFFIFLRTFVIYSSAPGRNKLVKELSDVYKKDHFESGIFLNVVTHGPTVLGALIGFISIKYLNYNWILVFDAVTFLINGYILVFLVSHNSKVNAAVAPYNLFKKIRIYLSHGNIAILDIMLALPFMGTNVLMSKLSFGIGYRVPLLLMTFGLSVFLTIPIVKKYKHSLGQLIGFVVLSLSFLYLIMVFKVAFELVLLGVFIRNICYWYLYNIFTGKLQEGESVENISSLFAARTFIGILIIAIGDLLFGFLGNSMSLQTDLTIRFILNMIPIGYLLIHVQKNKK